MQNSQDNPQQLLKECIENHRTDVLRSILAEIALQDGFDSIVNDCFLESGTLLHRAVELGDIDAVRTLLASGVNPSVINKSGKNPFQCANSETIREAFIHELIQSAAHSKIERVNQLLRSGVLVNSVDSAFTKNTPLHWAASYGNEEVVRTLCEGGANANQQNAHGETPLYEATKRKHSGIIQTMLSFRANPDIVNIKGESPRQVAASNPEVMQIFEAFELNTEMNRSHSLSSLDSSMMNGVKPEKPAKSEMIDFTAQLSAEQLLENWNKLLWPPPQNMEIFEADPLCWPENYHFPLIISENCAHLTADISEILNLYRLILAKGGLMCEIVGDRIDLQQPFISVMICNEYFTNAESYRLSISSASKEIRIFAADLRGFRWALVTLCQIVTCCTQAETFLPSLLVQDFPSVKHRGVVVEMNERRIFNMDSFGRILAAYAFAKMNCVLLHSNLMKIFPYAKIDLGNLQQICRNLGLDLGLSVEINDSETLSVESCADRLTTYSTMFKSSSNFILLGSNLSVFATKNPWIFQLLSGYFSKIFVNVGSKLNSNDLPIFCVPVSNETSIHSQPRLNSFMAPSALLVNASVQNLLTLSPENMLKSAIISGRSADSNDLLALFVADWTFSDRISFQSFASLTSWCIAGTAWNPLVDMKEASQYLAPIFAIHAFAEPNLLPLIQQMLVVGQIEADLGKTWDKSGSKSILLALLKNPDAVKLDQMNAMLFKKAKIELGRAYQIVHRVKSSLPYNFELAIAVGEVQLTLELLILAAKLGQSLCVAGTNPQVNGPHVGFNVVNVGINNLALTTRTDLANKLIALKQQFAHVWLSRHTASSLQESEKFFDGLLKLLLPPAFHNFPIDSINQTNGDISNI